MHENNKNYETQIMKQTANTIQTVKIKIAIYVLTSRERMERGLWCEFDAWIHNFVIHFLNTPTKKKRVFNSFYNTK